MPAGVEVGDKVVSVGRKVKSGRMIFGINGRQEGDCQGCSVIELGIKLWNWNWENSGRREGLWAGQFAEFSGLWDPVG